MNTTKQRCAPAATIAKRLNLSPEKALQVRQLIKGELNPETFASVQKWVSQCYNQPDTDELVMCALNEVLEGHGTEAITSESKWVSRFYGNIVLTYVNMGDTYIPTVCFDTDKETYFIGSWGDFVERNNL